jgi:PAS domain S-box-containing protein
MHPDVPQEAPHPQAILTGLTTREVAEAAVRHAEERLRALLDKGTDMITVSDRNGVILYASPTTERVSGYTAEEFRGSNPFLESIHPDDLPRCREAFARLLATPGLSLNLQHRARHRAGEWRWFEGTFTSLFHDPSVGGLVANVRDITERKQAEAERERLLQAEQAARAEAEAALDVRDQFLSIASHELRTPLTALIGYATLLQKSLAEGKDIASQERMAAIILRQAERLDALTVELLDVSRLQRGQFALEQQPLDSGCSSGGSWRIFA